MRLYLTSRHALVALTLISVSAIEVQAQTLKEEFLGKGVTRKVGGYRPIRAVMDKEADIIKVAPEDLEAPQYGQFEIGDNAWAFILDEPEEGEATLFLDSNGDGDLTNDPKPTWKSATRGELTQYSGSGELDLGDGKMGAINFYRFDPNDPRRAQLKDSVFYYSDFGYEYTFELDGQEFSTFAGGSPSESMRLPVDRNGDGKLSRRFEMASVGKPFNFTGTTYQFGISDGKLTLEEAAEALEQMPMPPDLTVGKQALTFSATTMDGDDVTFPSDYADKIVMLDFWATWCGPCIGEIPHMKEAYTNWHGDGFEILGVSFDSEGAEEKVQAFLEKNEQPWAQIYEGKGWDTTLGAQHDVSGIPFVILVDGDSGEILAGARQLRGPGLSDLIKAQLEKKFDIELEEKVKEEDSDEDKEDDDDSSEE